MSAHHDSTLWNNPNQIIQDEIQAYFTRTATRKKSILKWSLIGIASILFLGFLTIEGHTIAKTIRYHYRQFKLGFYDTRIQNQAGDIRLAVCEKQNVTPFNEYHLDSDLNYDPEIVKYAGLIHRLNSDFYGKVYNLDEQDERYLLSFIILNNYNLNDLCLLNEPLPDDTTQTKLSFIRKQTDETQKPYYNPVLQDLDRLSALYEDHYQTALHNPFSEEAIDNIGSSIAANEQIPLNWDAILPAVVEYGDSNPDFFRDVNYFKRKVLETEQELNLRLGLIFLAISQDFKVRSERQVFGWLAGGFKGQEFISSQSTPKEYRSYLHKLNQKYAEYRKIYRSLGTLYKDLNLSDWRMQIGNPLKIGLQVKDVGLFGAERKNDKGQYYEHQGIDLIAEEGTPVYPVQDGFVVTVETNDKGGNTVKIWHESNLVSSYHHLADDKTWKALKARFNREGAFWIGANQQLADVGTTGNIPTYSKQFGYAHLHLEIKQNNQYRNPLLLLDDKITVLHQ